MILVLIVYFICSVVSTLLLYEYLVYVHKDARILDLWRRVKGEEIIQLERSISPVLITGPYFEHLQLQLFFSFLFLICGFVCY